MMIVPELPEVETVRRTLTGLVKGKTIESADIRWPNIIKKPAEPEEFARQIAGETIRSIGRRESFCFSIWIIMSWCPTCGWRGNTVFIKPMSLTINMCTSCFT